MNARTSLALSIAVLGFCPMGVGRIAAADDVFQPAELTSNQSAPIYPALLTVDAAKAALVMPVQWRPYRGYRPYNWYGYRPYYAYRPYYRPYVYQPYYGYPYGYRPYAYRGYYRYY